MGTPQIGQGREQAKAVIAGDPAPYAAIESAILAKKPAAEPAAAVAADEAPCDAPAVVPVDALALAQ